MEQSAFIAAFKAETRDHLQKLAEGLLLIERNPADNVRLTALMRAAHSIKGAAAMMGQKSISEIAHHMENWLEGALRRGHCLRADHFDLLLESLDAIEALLENRTTWCSRASASPGVEDLCSRMAQVETTSRPAADTTGESTLATQGAKHPAPLAVEDTIRIDLARLNNLVSLSGELLAFRTALDDVVKNISEHMVSLIPSQESAAALQSACESLQSKARELVNDVSSEVMSLRMLPITYLFSPFRRAVRDLAADLGKEIELDLQGEDTRLDKTIIDGIKDPLLHVLRNAVDHGIEPPAMREACGKPRAGSITMSARQQGSQVVIEVRDDGCGVDHGRVKERAVATGLLGTDQAPALSDEQVLALLFTPGFSTNDSVTETSGRGIGLDVVREQTAKLRGTVALRSSPGKGTSITLALPLTLSVTHCLLVAVGDQRFAVPVDAVNETVRIRPEEIGMVNAKEAISLRGRVLPLIRLNELFGFSRRGIVEKRFLSALVLQAAEKEVAVLIDDVLGYQELVGKPLPPPLGRVKYIAGGAMLGDGRIVLMLDVHAVLTLPATASEYSRATRIKSPAVAAKRKTILLAEDTPSTALFEKNILESVGYAVVVARNGKEALQLASQERFDLVITDVLMPELDGFELTHRLKRDPLYQHIPVVVVTTRESPGDKRRGMEAGADAYLLKHEFTPEGLLEVLERLLG